MTRKTAQKLVEARFGKTAKELVHHLYYKKGLSRDAVAKELGVSVGSISTWMKEWGFPSRKMMLPRDIPSLE